MSEQEPIFPAHESQDIPSETADSLQEPTTPSIDTPGNTESFETITTDFSPRKMRKWNEFGLFLGLVGGGILLGSFVSILVVKILMPHISLFNLEAEMLKPENGNAFKVLQLASTITMFFVPAYLFALIAKKDAFSFLGFTKKASWQQAGLVFLIAWMAIYVGSTLAELNDWIPISKSLREYFKKAEDAYTEQVLVMATMHNLKEYFVALVVIAIVPAIVEETFFRGAMQQMLTRLFGNAWVAIIVTSIVFSAIHFSYFGFLTRASLGMILGMLFYYSKKIWLNIFAHALNNGIAVTSLYFYSINGKPAKDALEDHFPIWWGALGLAFLIALMINFKKKSEEQLA